MREREKPSIVGRAIEAIVKKISPETQQETHYFSLDDYFTGIPIHTHWRYKNHLGWSEEWTLSWDKKTSEWQIVYWSGASGTAALEAEAAGENPVSQREVTTDPHEVIPWLRRAYLITKDELPEPNKMSHCEIMVFVKEQIPEDVLIERSKKIIEEDYAERRGQIKRTKIIATGWEKPISQAT